MSGLARSVRDEAWLQELLDSTWDRYFGDIPQDNDVRIVFGRRTKRRLGSIRLDPTDGRTSIITMNGLFKLADVPEMVVFATLVHELIHYAQGFNSPIGRTQRHPHAGGVMRREYSDRGLLQVYLDQKIWLKNNWSSILTSYMHESGRPPRMARSSSVRVPRPFWLGRS